MFSGEDLSLTVVQSFDTSGTARGALHKRAEGDVDRAIAIDVQVSLLEVRLHVKRLWQH
jgi:hypothetical protein